MEGGRGRRRGRLARRKDGERGEGQSWRQQRPSEAESFGGGWRCLFLGATTRPTSLLSQIIYTPELRQNEKSIAIYSVSRYTIAGGPTKWWLSFPRERSPYIVRTAPYLYRDLIYSAVLAHRTDVDHMQMYPKIFSLTLS